MDYPSIWQMEKMPDYPPLEGDIRTDALVIGGGLCGLLTALRLREKGVASVTVLEADELCAGITSHTTAKITSQHGLVYDRLLQGLGRERAWLYAQANQQAVEEFAEMASPQSPICIAPDCDFIRCASVTYAPDSSYRRQVEREAEAALRLGLSAALVEETELPFPIAGGVRFEAQARFHPLKFAKALARRLEESGVAVYTHSRALHAGEGKRDGRVHTESGSVQAETVMVTTHFPFMDKPGFYFARIWQERSYVLALTNVLPMRDLYWGAGPSGYSFRPWSEGILVGGGSHKSGHEGHQAHYDQLAQASKNWYPERVVSAQWSAQDCMTHDGIPYIGRYKQLENWLGKSVYVATGFNKWGMTHSMVAADLLADYAVGKANAAAAVFSPSRFDPGLKAKRFFVESTDMLANYIGGYIPLPESVSHTLAPGEGRVVEIDGEKIGVYKDTDGQVYTVKPYCTHLGCVLEFNRDECSWDCPCHGSRYDVTGHILDNPAIAPLETPEETKKTSE